MVPDLIDFRHQDPCAQNSSSLVPNFRQSLLPTPTQAAPSDASSGSHLTPVAMQACAPCMHDSETRAAWRQVNRQARNDVYEATRSLQLREQQHRSHVMRARMHGKPPPPPIPTVLPAALLAKCTGLKRIDCSGILHLRSTHDLPAGLETLIYCNGGDGAAMAFAP